MPYSHPQPLDRNRAHQQVRHLLPGAVAFAMVAGYVNSVALGFFHTPVSHMTGAVSHLGIDFAEAKLWDAWASLSIVLGFLSGAILAGLIVGAWKLVPGRHYGVAMMGHWMRHRQIDLWKLRFLGWVVIAFTVGGCVGAAADLRYGPRCLALAAAVVSCAGGIFWFITHKGLVDLMQDASPREPRTGSFPKT